MAAELLSPLLAQRRQCLPAAPLFLLALLVVVVVFACSPVAVSSPELVDLTIVAGAQKKGAVCLDGTPPGYHLRRGFGSGAHSWLIYLQGGGWCNTIQSCSERKTTDFGSSMFMGAVEFTGILSNHHLENPGTKKFLLSWISNCCTSLQLYQHASFRGAPASLQFLFSTSQLFILKLD